jgi:hypothetical protein
VLTHISQERADMELSAVADDLNEVSVLVNVAHRLLLAIRDDVEASPSHQGILDKLNSGHDQLDDVLETIGSAIDQADAEAERQPREQRPTIH